MYYCIYPKYSDTLTPCHTKHPGRGVLRAADFGSQGPSQPQYIMRPTGDQEVAGSGSILSWRLNMKYFLQLFSPFSGFKKGSCQLLAKKNAHKYWLTA